MINYKRLKSEQGDTLIEVLISIAILSMVVVAAQAAMSYGQSLALRSVERTAAQGDLNSQFSYLRFARNEYMADSTAAGAQMWANIESKSQTGSSSAQVCNSAQQLPFKESGMFYIDETAALAATDAAGLAAAVVNYPHSPVGGVSQPVAANDVPRPGSGLWLIARSGGSKANGTAYIDFYGKACWSSLTGPIMEELTSVMRLYVP